MAIASGIENPSSPKPFDTKCAHAAGKSTSAQASAIAASAALKDDFEPGGPNDAIAAAGSDFIHCRWTSL